MNTRLSKELLNECIAKRSHLNWIINNRAQYASCKMLIRLHLNDSGLLVICWEQAGKKPYKNAALLPKLTTPVFIDLLYSNDNAWLYNMYIHWCVVYPRRMYEGTFNILPALAKWKIIFMYVNEHYTFIQYKHLECASHRLFSRFGLNLIFTIH